MRGLNLAPSLTGTVISGGGGTWTPANLATAPKAWYDSNSLTGADASSVSTFTDKEAAFNATLASGTAPILRAAFQNGLKVVEFSNSALSQMTMSSTLLSGATSGCFFAYFKLKNDPPLVSTTGGDAGAVLDAFTSDLGGTKGSHHPYTDGIIYDHFGVSTRQTVGNPTPSMSSSFRLLNVEMTSGGTYTVRLDGTQIFQATGQTVDFGAKTRNLGWTLGATENLYLNGYIGEILIMDYVPTTADRQKIEGYELWRFGTQANLPGGHPYAGGAP